MAFNGAIGLGVLDLFVGQDENPLLDQRFHWGASRALSSDAALKNENTSITGFGCSD